MRIVSQGFRSAGKVEKEEDNTCKEGSVSFQQHANEMNGNEMR